jgi:acetylornithine deacetylase/succinyl-diaminopimelate desuccinylase-like protein
VTQVDPQEEVVELCRDLIRFESVNDGTGRGKGEREAAEHVAGLLAEVGLEPQVFESERNRTSVVTRVEGEDSSRPALLVHGHLDVVPAEPKEWTYDPFAGEIADGMLWGRGAVDMLDMDAMTLAVVRDRLRTGRKPARDVVLALVADEEAGGVHGAQWLVEQHPGLFEGCTEAISEVGGFSLSCTTTCGCT